MPKADKQKATKPEAKAEESPVAVAAATGGARYKKPKKEAAAAASSSAAPSAQASSSVSEEKKSAEKPVDEPKLTSTSFRELLTSLNDEDNSVRETTTRRLLSHVKRAQAAFVETKSDPASSDSAFFVLSLAQAPELAACCTVLRYSIARAIRGLPSPNEFGRQGYSLFFTALLTEFKAILPFPFLATTVHSLAYDAGGKNVKENAKHAALGRCFGYLAFLQADCLKVTSEDDSLMSNLTAIIIDLVQIALERQALRELAISTITHILTANKSMPRREFDTKFVPALLPLFTASPEAIPADALQLMLFLEREYDFKYSARIPFLGGKSVFDASNLSRIMEGLKMTSLTMPRVHPIWDSITTTIFQNGTVKSDILSFLWTNLVEPKFFSAHKEARQSLGLHLATLWVTSVLTLSSPSAIESCVPIVLSSTYLTLLFEAMVSNDRVSFGAKAAHAAMAAIEQAAPTVPAIRATIQSFLDAQPVELTSQWLFSQFGPRLAAILDPLPLSQMMFASIYAPVSEDSEAPQDHIKRAISILRSIVDNIVSSSVGQPEVDPAKEELIFRILRTAYVIYYFNLNEEKIQAAPVVEDAASSSSKKKKSKKQDAEMAVPTGPEADCPPLSIQQLAGANRDDLNGLFLTMYKKFCVTHDEHRAPKNKQPAADDASSKVAVSPYVSPAANSARWTRFFKWALTTCVETRGYEPLVPLDEAAPATLAETLETIKKVQKKLSKLDESSPQRPRLAIILSLLEFLAIRLPGGSFLEMTFLQSVNDFYNNIMVQIMNSADGSLILADGTNAAEVLITMLIPSFSIHNAVIYQSCQKLFKLFAADVSDASVNTLLEAFLPEQIKLDEDDEDGEAKDMDDEDDDDEDDADSEEDEDEAEEEQSSKKRKHESDDKAENKKSRKGEDGDADGEDDDEEEELMDDDQMLAMDKAIEAVLAARKEKVRREKAEKVTSLEKRGRAAAFLTILIQEKPSSAAVFAILTTLCKRVANVCKKVKQGDSDFATFAGQSRRLWVEHCSAKKVATDAESAFAAFEVCIKTCAESGIDREMAKGPASVLRALARFYNASESHAANILPAEAVSRISDFLSPNLGRAAKSLTAAKAIEEICLQFPAIAISILPAAAAAVAHKPTVFIVDLFRSVLKLCKLSNAPASTLSAVESAFVTIFSNVELFSAKKKAGLVLGNNLLGGCIQFYRQVGNNVAGLQATNVLSAVQALNTALGAPSRFKSPLKDLEKFMTPVIALISNAKAPKPAKTPKKSAAAVAASAPPAVPASSKTPAKAAKVSAQPEEASSSKTPAKATSKTPKKSSKKEKASE